MRVDNDIVYIGIDVYTLYWMMPIMFSYSIYIRSLNQILPLIVAKVSNTIAKIESVQPIHFKTDE